MVAPAAPSRITRLLLPNPTPGGGGSLSGPGAWVDVSQMVDLMFDVNGTFVGTFSIETSFDQAVGSNKPGASDLNGVTNFTAVQCLGFVVPCPVFMRVNWSAWTSGAAQVYIQGARRSKQSS